MSGSTLNLENWLALSHCPGIGPIKFKKYLEYDPSLNSLPTNLKPDWSGVKKDLAWLAQNTQAQILTLNDLRYPALLKQIYDAPPVLYVLGDTACLAQPQIAIVGSRQCSSTGQQQAEIFAKKLTSLGIVITSGLALGIDAASHRGALELIEGKTIAVLAHGLDRVYPDRHRQLATQIMRQGCLVSEFPIDVIPLPKHFPRRNRIISGLSMGVLVVEADVNSGSLLTARYAIDQGREVFALPGPINMPNKRGCHQLIKQGAKLVECLEDVLEELGALLNSSIRDKYADTASASPQIRDSLTVQQQQLIEFMDYDSTSVDSIVERTGLASSAVSAILLELELQGVVNIVPGGYARKLD